MVSEKNAMGESENCEKREHGEWAQWEGAREYRENISREKMINRGSQ